MCEEAIQGRIMKITDGKLGHFLFPFPIQAAFLTEYLQIFFPSLFRMTYTNDGAITGSPGRLFHRIMGLAVGIFFT